MKKLKGKILPIKIYGEEVLRLKSEPVIELNDEIRQFIADLTETMYKKDGVGLAAPQVGRSLRIFVVDPFWFQEGNKKDPLILINPEFIEFEGEESLEEGCLSLPDIYAKVNRAQKVIIEGFNENWEKVRIEAEDLFARALQHENDHLDGILFIDRVPKLKRIPFLKDLKQLEQKVIKSKLNS
ncbi:peptide deformylase [Candidatus Cloacimonadota bacterium]